MTLHLEKELLSESQWVETLSLLKNTFFYFRRDFLKVAMIKVMHFLGERDIKEIDSESKGLCHIKEKGMKNDTLDSPRESECTIQGCKMRCSIFHSSCFLLGCQVPSGGVLDVTTHLWNCIQNIGIASTRDFWEGHANIYLQVTAVFHSLGLSISAAFCV